MHSPAGGESNGPVRTAACGSTTKRVRKDRHLEMRWDCRSRPVGSDLRPSTSGGGSAQSTPLRRGWSIGKVLLAPIEPGCLQHPGLDAGHPPRVVGNAFAGAVGTGCLDEFSLQGSHIHATFSRGGELGLEVHALLGRDGAG